MRSQQCGLAGTIGLVLRRFREVGAASRGEHDDSRQAAAAAAPPAVVQNKVTASPGHLPGRVCMSAKALARALRAADAKLAAVGPCDRLTFLIGVVMQARDLL